MTICGKPVRFVGKIASGNFTYCTRIAGHLGACDEKATGETESASQRSASEPVNTDPEEGWMLSGVEPDDGDEQASDPFLPPYVRKIPEGVVFH